MLYLRDILSLYDQFNITEHDVLTTYQSPDRTESLPNANRLYLKSFNNLDDKRRYLLIATQSIEAGETLGFALWIPRIYITPNSALIDILDIFCHRYGLRIKVGTVEGYLIRYAERLIYGNIEDQQQNLIETIAPDQVPCIIVGSIDQTPLGTLRKIRIYNAFALNSGKYHLWINSTPQIALDLKSQWHDFVKTKMLEFIQPDGKTKIVINHQMPNDHLDDDNSNDLSPIEVPIIYEDQFRHIFNQINRLKKQEVISFGISIGFPKCLFCHSSQTSKEHIFPKWLRPFTKETFIRVTQLPFVEGAVKIATTTKKKESSHGYTTQFICESCNITWMSKLESEVKSLLIQNDALVPSIPTDISKESALTLSRWLIIKALLLVNKSAADMSFITFKILENLKNGNIDEGFMVETTITKSRDGVEFILVRGALDINVGKISIDQARELTKNFFTCSIRLNHLIFRISFLDPTIPFKREIGLKKTAILFPFGADIRFVHVVDAEQIWEQGVSENVEILILTRTIGLYEYMLPTATNA